MLAVCLAASGACNRDTGPAVPAEVRATLVTARWLRLRQCCPRRSSRRCWTTRGTPLPGVMVGWTSAGDRANRAGLRANRRPGARGGALGPGARCRRSRTRSRACSSLPPAAFSAVAEPSTRCRRNGSGCSRSRPMTARARWCIPTTRGRRPAAFAYGHHLAITPYPFGNAAYENPSSVASLGQPGLLAGRGRRDTNPVASPESGHLSDPDVVFDAGVERAVALLPAGDAGQRGLADPLRRRAARGVAPVEVARRPNHEIVSPAVVRRRPVGVVHVGGELGAVRVRGLFYGRGVAALPRRAPLVGPRAAGVSRCRSSGRGTSTCSGFEARGEFWAVFNAKTRSGCTTPAVFIARSADGVHWTVGTRPVIAKERIPEFEHIVYRSTFDYEPAGDMITFWYSGRGTRRRGTCGAPRWSGAGGRRSSSRRRRHWRTRIYEEPPAPLRRVAVRGKAR